MRKKISLFVKQNPVFGMTLGLCPLLAITTTFENSYLMGISLLFILILSNSIVSLIRKWVPNKIRIPIYITIIGIFVTILEYLLFTYVPQLKSSLGIYIPLIIVNCLVLGRALGYASRHNLKDSIKDALKMGLGYTFSLSLVGIIREVLGSNTLTLMENTTNVTGYLAKYQVFPTNSIIPNQFFASPAGVLLIVGLLFGLLNMIKGVAEK